MTKSEIIKQANDRTENRAVNVLDTSALLDETLQEFCSEYRFYWRKKSITFNTSVGVATYDLSDVNGINEPDFEQAISVKFVRSDGSLGEIEPEFDTVRQDELIEDTGASGDPGVYFVERGTAQTIRFYPVPQSVYKIRLSYWAMPNTVSDSDASDAVPLVPPGLHHILVKGLMAKILQFTLGEGNPRYVSISQAYEREAAKAAEKRDFAEGRYRTFATERHSVRSTH